MKKENILKSLSNPSLPIGAKDWFIEEYRNIMGWSVESSFHQTPCYTLEGLYKPISMCIPFGKMVKLEIEE